MHDISALGEQKIAIGTPHMASALETEARQSLTAQAVVIRAHVISDHSNLKQASSI